MTYPRRINRECYVLYNSGAWGRVSIGRVTALWTYESGTTVMTDQPSSSVLDPLIIPNVNYAVVVDCNTLDIPWNHLSVPVSEVYDTLAEALAPYEKALIQQFTRKKLERAK